MRASSHMRGFSLLELLVGSFLSTLLLAGMVQLIGSSLAAYRLQLEQGRVSESLQFARETLSLHLSQAGYHPSPWALDGQMPALTGATREGGDTRGDTLGLQRWSRLNCMGNENPAEDGEGQPAFFLMQVELAVNRSNNLAMTCRYGPGKRHLVTQVNNQGLVENIESLQALYAEDQDGDGVADRWVKAGAWENEDHVIAARVALLAASAEPLLPPAPASFAMLDTRVQTAADGRLRRVGVLTAAIRGRLR